MTDDIKDQIVSKVNSYLDESDAVHQIVERAVASWLEDYLDDIISDIIGS